MSELYAVLPCICRGSRHLVAYMYALYAFLYV
jgi:hypothetical protein